MKDFIVVRNGYPYIPSYFGPFTEEEANYWQPILQKESVAKIVKLNDPAQDHRFADYAKDAPTNPPDSSPLSD